jgi:hypothetical protein
MSNVSDAFTGVASSILTTADTGQTWSAFGGGSLGRDGSGNATTVVATGEAGMVVDSGSPNAIVSAVLNSTGSEGIIFRFSDGNNFWAAQLIGTTLYTRKYVAGVYTDLTNTSLTLTAGDTWSIDCNGSSIVIKQNGVTIRSLTDTFNQSATKWGILARPGALYGSFSVTNAASGGSATKIVVTQQPVGGTAGNLLPTQPAAQIQDASSVLVSTATNSITATLNIVSGSGSLTGTATRAAVAGSRIDTDLRVTAPGTYTITYSAAGLTSATTAPFTITGRSLSPYRGLGRDGKDLGYDKSIVDAHMVPTISGDRRNVTETRYSAGTFVYDGVTVAAYPRTLLNTDTFPTRTGTLRNVTNDATLQAAINAAVPGDWIIVAAGNYLGDYRDAFPVKAGDLLPGGNGVIVVMGKQTYDSIDPFTGKPTVHPPLVRVTSNANMPRFLNTRSLGSFRVAGPTRGWRFVGLSFEQDVSLLDSGHFVEIGDGTTAQNSATLCPSNVILDRCWFNGHPMSNTKHCVELNGKASGVIDCGFGTDIHHNGSESHVICGYNGPGPFRIINNGIVGGSQFIFFGGATSLCGAPADIECRWNDCTRPDSWNPAHPSFARNGYYTPGLPVDDPNYNDGVWQVKCGIEAKFVQYGLFEGNRVRNCWPAGQQGAAFLLKAESYGTGATFGYTHDVMERCNLVEQCGFGVNIAGVDNVEPAYPPANVASVGSIIKIGAQYFNASENPFYSIGFCRDARIIHVTCIAEGVVGQAIALPGAFAAGTVNGDGKADGLYIADSIFDETNYGWKGTDAGEGILSTVAPGSVAVGNVIVDMGGTYPAGTTQLATRAQIGFTDDANNDFSLYGTTQGAVTTPPPAVRAASLALRLAR